MNPSLVNGNATRREGKDPYDQHAAPFVTQSRNLFTEYSSQTQTIEGKL